jgi:hypothetical protein
MNENARGRDIIAQVVENMRGQTEELVYTRVVSSSYNVHLHATDYARLEQLVPEIVAQARRALDEELDRMNRSRPLEDRVRRWVRQPRVPYQRLGPVWSISILSDPNDELEPGDILVDATLVTSDPERYDGSLTRRIVTHRHGDQVERRVAFAEGPPSSAAAPAAATPAPPPEPAPEAGVIATLTWRDDRGEHVFHMTTPTIKIGRGGPAYWVDVRLDTVPDVSREHVRIRYDDASRRFYAQDLSSFGTTVDGVALPPRPAEPASAEGPEVPIPPRATIALAGAVALAFEARA